LRVSSLQKKKKRMEIKQTIVNTYLSIPSMLLILFVYLCYWCYSLFFFACSLMLLLHLSDGNSCFVQHLCLFNRLVFWFFFCAVNVLHFFFAAFLIWCYSMIFFAFNCLLLDICNITVTSNNDNSTFQCEGDMCMWCSKCGQHCTINTFVYALLNDVWKCL
jgi:hypothetical protein